MKRTLRGILDRLGLEITRKRRGVIYGPTPGYHRLDRLPSMKTVIDIGVGHRGSRFLYERGWDAFYICIDPLHEARDILAKVLPQTKYRFIQCAAGQQRTSHQNLHVSATPSRTSLLKRVHHDQSSLPDETRVTTVERLDDLITRDEIRRPALLKIDVEGGELDCLRGGRQVVEMMDYVLLELPLTDNYSESYRFSDVITFMSYSEFEPLMILKAGNNNVDIVFCRRSDPIREELSYGADTNARARP